MTQSPAAFSWRATLRRLGRPGPPPPGLRLAAVVLLTSCLAALVTLLWLGHAWHGDAHRYFRARKTGPYLSFANLLATALVAGAIGQRLVGRPFARFWRITAAGFAWLALDDIFLLHDRVERSLHEWLGYAASDFLVDHLDDLVVAAYGVAALALAYRYRADLARFPWMVLILSVAFALFTGMVVADVLDLSRTLEDCLKLMAGTVILLGFVAARLDLTAPAVAAGWPREVRDDVR